MKSRPNTLKNLTLFFWALTALFSIFLALEASAKLPGGEKNRPDAIIDLIEKDYHIGQEGNYTMSLHLKTTIKTYRGRKNWADFRVAYNSQLQRVKIIEAKTIRPDGSVIKVTPKEIHDITDPSTQAASLFSASRLKVVNFPSVEEGCTVELTLEKKSRMGLWTLEAFSGDNPIKLKTVRVSLPKTMPLSIHLKSKAIKMTTSTDGKIKTYTWTGRNRPKIISEPFMPPVSNRPDTLILSTYQSWKEVGELFKGILLAENHNKSVPLQLNLDQFKHKDPNRLFIQLSKGLEIYPIVFFKSNLKVQAPAKTLALGYGSQMDAIVLFQQILKTWGLDSKIIAVNSRGIFFKELLNAYSPGLFNTFLVECRNRFYSFDMKEAPPGITGMDSQLGLDIESGKFITVRDSLPKETIQSYKVDLTSPDSFVVDYNGEFSGTSSIAIKNTFKDLTPAEFRVHQSIFYHSLHPLAEALTPLQVKGLTPESSRASTHGKYQVRNFAIKNQKYLFFPLQAPGILNSLFTLLPERQNDLFIGKPAKESIQVFMTYPEEIRPKKLPSMENGSIGPVLWQRRCTDSRDKRSVSCYTTVRVKRGLIHSGAEFERLRETVQSLMDVRGRTITMEAR